MTRKTRKYYHAHAVKGGLAKVAVLGANLGLSALYTIVVVDIDSLNKDERGLVLWFQRFPKVSRTRDLHPRCYSESGAGRHQHSDSNRLEFRYCLGGSVAPTTAMNQRSTVEPSPTANAHRSQP
eukprot:3867228-Amphidinium_carterae.1